MGSVEFFVLFYEIVHVNMVLFGFEFSWAITHCLRNWLSLQISRYIRKQQGFLPQLSRNLFLKWTINIVLQSLLFLQLYQIQHYV
jgi:hypothetical protein